MELKMPEENNDNRDLDLSRLSSTKEFKGLVIPKKIEGELDLRDLSRLSSTEKFEGLVVPKKIEGELDFRNLTNAESLILPQELRDNLDLKEFSIEELEKLKKLLDSPRVKELEEYLSKHNSGDSEIHHKTR